MTKVCKICREAKTLDAYSPSPKNYLRCATTCRECVRAMCQQQRDQGFSRRLPREQSGAQSLVAGRSARARRVVALVCAHFRIEPQEWGERHVTGRPLEALRYAIWLLCADLNLPARSVAALVGKKSRGVVHHHCGVMAQLQAEPTVAAHLATLRRKIGD